jgi:hypothetical protein
MHGCPNEDISHAWQLQDVFMQHSILLLGKSAPREVIMIICEDCCRS